MNPAEAVRIFVECRDAVRRSVPARLHHYTTVEGFAGILQSGLIRATNYRVLSDLKEVEYGRGLVRMQLLTGQAAVGVGQSTLQEAIQKEFEQQPPWEVFVGCFSKSADDPELWTRFGASYCLEFDAQRLLDYARRNRKQRLSFHPVFYAGDQHDSEIENIVSCAQRANDRGDGSEACLRAVAKEAAKALIRLLPKFKSMKYHVEQEWRFIQWLAEGDVDQVEFDTSRSSLRPYTCVELPVPIPVTKVLLRTAGNQNAAVKAASMLVRKAKLDAVVELSCVGITQ